MSSADRVELTDLANVGRQASRMTGGSWTSRSSPKSPAVSRNGVAQFASGRTGHHRQRKPPKEQREQRRRRNRASLGIVAALAQDSTLKSFVVDHVPGERPVWTMLPADQDVENFLTSIPREELRSPRRQRTMDFASSSSSSSSSEDSSDDGYTGGHSLGIVIPQAANPTISAAISSVVPAIGLTEASPVPEKPGGCTPSTGGSLNILRLPADVSALFPPASSPPAGARSITGGDAFLSLAAFNQSNIPTAQQTAGASSAGYSVAGTTMPRSGKQSKRRKNKHYRHSLTGSAGGPMTMPPPTLKPSTLVSEAAGSFLPSGSQQHSPRFPAESKLGTSSPNVKFAEGQAEQTTDSVRLRRGRRLSRAPSSRSSRSSSSSSGNTWDAVPRRVVWLDVHTENQDLINRVLQSFPTLHPEVAEDIAVNEDPDTLRTFAAAGYFFCNMECTAATHSVPGVGMHSVPSNPHVGGLAGGSGGSLPSPPGDSIEVPEASGRHSPADVSNEDNPAQLTAIIFEDWIITIHSEPIVGIVDCLQRVDMQLKLRRSHNRQLNCHASVSPQPMDSAPATMRGAASGGPAHLTTGWLFATLLDSLVEAGLPDTPGVLHEVHVIDEMVLTVREDQHDLLRRMARVRRIVGTFRAALFRKERLLQQLLGPTLRATCIVRRHAAEQYRQTTAQLQEVSDRLDAARDGLTQANSNFVSQVALDTAHVSNLMSRQMQLLSQIATICLPLNILTGAFGMNVTVPFQTGEGSTSLVPFIIISVVLVGWLVTCSMVLFKMRNSTPNSRSLHLQNEMF